MYVQLSLHGSTMGQQDKLDLALKELQTSSNPAAYKFLSTAIASIEGVPRAESYRITNWFNIGRTALANARHLYSLWSNPKAWYTYNKATITYILGDPKAWKVILLALPQIKDFHPDIMPKVLDSLILAKTLEAQRAFMETKAGKPVTTEELQQVLAGMPSKHGAEIDELVRHKCDIIKDANYSQAEYLYKYTMFIADSLSNKDNGYVNSLCCRLATLSQALVGNSLTAPTRERFYQIRHNHLYNRMLADGYSEKDITAMMFDSHEMLEQEFQAADKLSDIWSKRYKSTPKEVQSLKTKLLKMIAYSMPLQDSNHIDVITTAAANIIGKKEDSTEATEVTVAHKEIFRDPSIPTAAAENITEGAPLSDKIDIVDTPFPIEMTSTDKEEELLQTIVNKQLDAIKVLHEPEKIRAEDSASDELFYEIADENLDQSITNAKTRNTNIKETVTALLQGGFLDSSFQAIIDPNFFSKQHSETASDLSEDEFFDATDKLSEDTSFWPIIPIVTSFIKSLTSSGRSNLGLDLPADGTPWTAHQADAIQRHHEYHYNPEYKSILKALEPDIVKILPFLQETSLRYKISALTKSLLTHKVDGMYYILNNILALITSKHDLLENQELKLADVLATDQTPAHVSNLILAILYERYAVCQKRTFFQITADSGKPLLQMLEPVVTTVLTAALKDQNTRAPALEIFKAIYNDSDPENNTLTLLKPPHSMTRLQILEFLALSAKEQQKYKTRDDTKELLLKQVSFYTNSIAKRNKAIIDFIKIDSIQTALLEDITHIFTKDEDIKDFASLIANILHTQEDSLSQDELNALKPLLAELIKIVLTDDELKIKITKLLFDAADGKHNSSRTLYIDQIISIVFNQKIKSALTNNPTALLPVARKLFKISINEKELRAIAAALPKEHKEKLSYRDIITILGKIPLLTIISLHSKISFSDDNILLLGLTYPIHLMLLILSLPIIASLSTASTTIDYIIQTTKATEFKPAVFTNSTETDSVRAPMTPNIDLPSPY